ncbi:MAG TPA: hypothetical protein VII97_07625 [Anaerolineales bacterium]
MITNLIDTYVSEVGRRLPRKTRTDIEAEIRSILQDMLDERSQKTGNPIDDEMTLEVLKAYGSPEKVAATYLGERYLIGPRLYPIFILVLRIILTVTGILAAIGLGIALSQAIGNPQNTFETILKAVANLVASLMTALGNIVLIFAILEWALFRAGGKVDVKGLPKEKEWDPRSLTKVSLPNQVKMGETIVEIVGCFAAIVIFNFYPQIIGFTPSLNGVIENGNWSSVTFVPLLSEAFFYYVPFLTLVWALTIILDIVLLRMGHWNTLTRVFVIGLKVIGIIIAGAILAGPSLLAVTVETLTASLGAAGAAQILMPFLSQLVHLVLWLLIILGSLDVVRLIYRLILSKKLPFITIKKN